MQGPKARVRVMRGPASNSAVNLSSRGGRDSKPELKTSNTKPETGIKGKPEPKKGTQRARGGSCAYGRGSIARGKGEGHKNGNSISGRGVNSSAGKQAPRQFDGERKANPKQTANETPEKTKAQNRQRSWARFKGD